MRKCAFKACMDAKAQSVSVQSDLGLCCPFTESLEYMMYMALIGICVTLPIHLY